MTATLLSQIELDESEVFEAVKQHLTRKYNINYETICSFISKDKLDMVIVIQNKKLERRDQV